MNFQPQIKTRPSCPECNLPVLTPRLRDRRPDPPDLARDIGANN